MGPRNLSCIDGLSKGRLFQPGQQPGPSGGIIQQVLHIRSLALANFVACLAGQSANGFEKAGGEIHIVFEKCSLNGVQNIWKASGYKYIII